MFLWTFSKCSVSLGFFTNWLLSILEQPESSSTWRELSPKMIFRLRTRFLQFFRFNKVCSIRILMDGSIWSIFIHPSKVSFSKWGTPLMFGIWLRFLECLRSRVLKLGKHCNRNKSKKNLYPLNTRKQNLVNSRTQS